jgi:iron complex transport system ATP-binding protein
VPTDLVSLLNLKHKLTIVTVLHEINLAARYSSRIAMLNKGKLFCVGTPAQVLTHDNLAEIFGVEAIVLETSVGVQICAIAPVFRT